MPFTVVGATFWVPVVWAYTYFSNGMVDYWGYRDHEFSSVHNYLQSLESAILECF